MDRAEFLRVAGAACVSLCVAPSHANAQSTRPPNILWLSSEDMSPNLGCYGDPHAHTPVIDALAAKGKRFSRAFAVAPVCAPNRSCIISGCYPPTLGSHLMRSTGVEGAGKPQNPKLPPHVRCFSSYLRDAGYYCTNNEKEDYNFDKPDGSWDESSKTAHWKNRVNPDQPFFAVFNYTDTHESAVRRPQEWIEKTTQRLTPEQRQDPEKIVPPPYHPNTPIVRQQWANYHELITSLDYWVADHLQALEEAGLAENTIVFYWSDHGAGIPRSKRWLYDSGMSIPLIVYAPPALQAHASIAPGTVDDRLVSCVDFAPTVLTLAGVPIPKHMQGQHFLGANQPAPREYVFGARDRMDECYDLFRAVRDKRYKYIRNYMPFKPYGQYLNYCELSPIMQELRRLQSENALPPGCEWVATPRKPVEEFYDTDSDPHELNNLADKPEFNEQIATFRGVHEQWQRDTFDLGFIPEPELVRLQEQHGFRYEVMRAKMTAQPDYMDALRTIVLAAGNGDIETLTPMAMHADPIFRHWAVVGLRLVAPRTESVRKSLTQAAKDAESVVAIEAHRAFAEENQAEALDALVRELQSNNEWLRVQAATALDEIGENARPAISALEKALDDPNNKYVVRIASHTLFKLTGTKRTVQ